MIHADMTIHVIDDDAQVRRSLAFLLGSAGFEAATHESALAFLEVLPGIGPGCILTDVRMPDMNGIDLLKRLRQPGGALPVIVMTGHGDLSLAVEAMKAGALDFLEKPFDDDALLASVRMAIGLGGTNAHHEQEGHEYHRRIDTLSARERHVFEGLVAGQPNKLIAQSLGVGTRTVEVDRANVMGKMEARSLSRLVRMAMIVGKAGDDRSS